MIEYWKNLDLRDLFYINDDGLVCCEEWRDVPNYIGYYQASDLGRIKALSRIKKCSNGNTRIIKEVIKKQTIAKNGYLCISTVSCSGKSKVWNVHTFVSMAFLNHKPSKYNAVTDHKNNIKLDNKLSNLQIISHRENCSKDKIGTSKYTGVFKRKDRPSWTASIRINSCKIIFSSIKIEEKAKLTYDLALLNKDLFLGDKKVFKKQIRDMVNSAFGS
jgi:hypothetical protein